MDLYKYQGKENGILFRWSTEDDWYSTDKEEWKHHNIVGIQRSECLSQGNPAFETYDVWSFYLLRLGVFLFIKRSKQCLAN